MRVAVNPNEILVSVQGQITILSEQRRRNTAGNHEYALLIVSAANDIVGNTAANSYYGVLHDTAMQNISTVYPSIADHGAMAVDLLDKDGNNVFSDTQRIKVGGSGGSFGRSLRYAIKGSQDVDELESGGRDALPDLGMWASLKCSDENFSTGTLVITVSGGRNSSTPSALLIYEPGHNLDEGDAIPSVYYLSWRGNGHIVIQIPFKIL